MTYIPEFETQRDEGAPLPWTNCNPASHAMLLDQWSYGRIKTSDIALRKASGVDPSLGTNFAANAKAIKALFELDLRYSDVNAAGNGNKPMTWAQLRDHLSSGGSAVVCGHYSSLRGHVNTKGQAVDRWQPGGTFGHAVHVVDYNVADGTVFWQDPLGHGDYTGDRIKLTTLWAFIWKEGNDSSAIITASYTMAQARPAPADGEPATGETWTQRIKRELAECRETAAARYRRIQKLLAAKAALETQVEELTKRVRRLQRKLANAETLTQAELAELALAASTLTNIVGTMEEE